MSNLRRRLVVRVIVAVLAGATLLLVLAMHVPVGYVRVRGHIYLSRGTTQLYPPFDYYPFETPSLTTAPGSYSIRLIGPFGWTLADYPLTPLVPDGPRGGPDLVVLEDVPWVWGTRRVAIYSKGVELTSAPAMLDTR